MPEGALIVRVAEVLPPLVKVALAGKEHVIPEAAVQVRLTVPEKPLTDARLIAVDPLLPAVTGTFDDAGMSVKSDNGFGTALPPLSVTADGP